MLASKTCATCDCDKLGSVSPKCDTSGKCTCRNKFYGKKCSNKDCEVGDWAVWSTCRCDHSKTKTQTRKVTSTFLGNGKKCSVLTENWPMCNGGMQMSAREARILWSLLREQGLQVGSMVQVGGLSQRLSNKRARAGT